MVVFLRALVDALRLAFARCSLRSSCLFDVTVLIRFLSWHFVGDARCAYSPCSFWSDYLLVLRKCCSNPQEGSVCLNYSCLDNTLMLSDVALRAADVSAPTTNFRWGFFLTGRSSAQDSSGLDARRSMTWVTTVLRGTGVAKGLDNLLN